MPNTERTPVDPAAVTAFEETETARLAPVVGSITRSGRVELTPAGKAIVDAIAGGGTGEPDADRVTRLQDQYLAASRRFERASEEVAKRITAQRQAELLGISLEVDIKEAVQALGRAIELRDAASRALADAMAGLPDLSVPTREEAALFDNLVQQLKVSAGAYALACDDAHAAEAKSDSAAAQHEIANAARVEMNRVVRALGTAFTDAIARRVAA